MPFDSFGILAAGLGEHEPSNRYMQDLLLDDRSGGDDFRMALAYVSLFKKISMTPKERFLVDFPEIVSAVGHFQRVPTSEAGDRLFDLFQRHAKSVEEVVSSAVKEHSAALYRNELPAASLLAASYNRGHVEIAPPSNYDADTKAFMDRLSAPILEFAFDDDRERVHFRGGLVLEGANFKLVAALIEAFRNSKKRQTEVPYLPAPDLAQRLDISDQSMRQQFDRPPRTGPI